MVLQIEYSIVYIIVCRLIDLFNFSVTDNMSASTQKKKRIKAVKPKLRAKEPLLGVFMWGVSYSASIVSWTRNHNPVIDGSHYSMSQDYDT